MNGPATRLSLILELRDPSHHEAWEEFVAIYEPLVYRLALSKGFQHADAKDLCQDVLQTVGQAIGGFDLNRDKGSFRGWLFRIARNLIVNVMTRSKEVRGTGDSAVQHLLELQAHENGNDASQFDIEYKREVFHWAAERVRARTDSATWQAFWMTAVDGRSAEQVSQALEKAPGTIRVARCRVLAKIKKEVDRFEEYDEKG